MAETAVKESKDRVRSAILNSQFNFPQQRITINLAPADLPKEGGRFDLPIALGILAASGQLAMESLQDKEFIGELSLTGECRPVRGVLPTTLAATKQGNTLVLPAANANEAKLIQQSQIMTTLSLIELCAELSGQASLSIHKQTATKPIEPKYLDMEDVKGQPRARRALEIAAAGKHSLLFSGPPGTGKTMLASRLPGILGSMSDEEALESAAVYSISTSGFDPQNWRLRPFRSPHHTASSAALVGGGGQPKPGEISLAHNGILFLDELPEFDRRVLEVLREPLESGRITISRAANQAEFPAKFQLVAAMNPCPCGYLGQARCRCTEEQVARYRARVSGPLMDRIDMLVTVPPVDKHALRHDKEMPKPESSAVIRQRVSTAQSHQLDRQGVLNHGMSQKDIEAHCTLSDADYGLLEKALTQLGLSARAYHRVLKLARTIADLAGSENIERTHLTEAITYRRLDSLTA
jgi:magnesium chelatase family protein